MATNPYEEASSSRARGGGRIWLVALAVAALVTTVAWAAPLGGQRPTAELSYGTCGRRPQASLRYARQREDEVGNDR